MKSKVVLTLEDVVTVSTLLQIKLWDIENDIKSLGSSSIFLQRFEKLKEIRDKFEKLLIKEKIEISLDRA